MNIKIKYPNNNIEQLVAETGITKCTMLGANEQLKKIKEWVEANYDNVAYFDYDIRYHGWDGKPAENIENIRNQLVNEIEKIYAICLAGLGEE